MTADPQDPPVHRVSRVEDRERLLAEALAHSEALEEQYRISYASGPPRGRWKAPVSLALFAAAAVIAVTGPGWIGPAPAPEPSGADLERGLRVAIYLQARQVEVFRVRHGRLPSTMEDMEVHLPGVRFVRSSGRVFQLVGTRPDGTALVYDSARPEPGFDRVVESWLGLGEP